MKDRNILAIAVISRSDWINTYNEDPLRVMMSSVGGVMEQEFWDYRIKNKIDLKNYTKARFIYPEESTFRKSVVAQIGCDDPVGPDDVVIGLEFYKKC